MVASRSEIQDYSKGLVKLDPDVQVRMIKLLLDSNADKTALVGGLYCPYDLLGPNLGIAKDLLKIPRPGPRSTVQPSSTVGSSSSSGAESPAILNSSSSSSSLVIQGDQDPMLNQINQNFIQDSHYFDHHNNFQDNQNDFDAIAEALISHPTIQAIVDDTVALNIPNDQPPT